jgi:hypothetical protein
MSNGIREKAKEIWLKGMNAVGNAAANIANNTRYKVDEVTIQNRRREVLGDLAAKAYTLWLKGIEFPDEMVRMLDELKTLDEQLNDMRAEKYASAITAESSAEKADPESSVPGDTSRVEQPETLSPVNAEIDHLFDGVPSVEQMAEKVNTSLDQMSEQIRSFSAPGSDDPQKGQE